MQMSACAYTSIKIKRTRLVLYPSLCYKILFTEAVRNDVLSQDKASVVEWVIWSASFYFNMKPSHFELNNSESTKDQQIPKRQQFTQRQ